MPSSTVTRIRSSRAVASVTPEIAQGVQLFSEMMLTLEHVDENTATSPSDRCGLQPKYWRGQPFRNIAAEVLAQAQTVGPDAAAAFMVCVSDYLSTVSTGSVPIIGLCYGKKSLAIVAKAIASMRAAQPTRGAA
jgi:hypothetical protein